MEITTYKDGPYGRVYLQLHDRRIWWDIENPILASVDGEIFTQQIIDEYINKLEQHYKNLTVYCLGRSGRHVCIENTPINRKRYLAVQKYANKLTEQLIAELNNVKFVEEEV